MKNSSGSLITAVLLLMAAILNALNR